MRRRSTNSVTSSSWSPRPGGAYDGGRAGAGPHQPAVDRPTELDIDGAGRRGVRRRTSRPSSRRSSAAAGIDAAVQGDSYTYALNGFEASITAATQAEAAAPPPGVAMVLQTRSHQLHDRQLAEVPRPVGPEPGPWAAALTGEDVVVGVIDTGIWPEHPSFADDGSYPTAAASPTSPASSVTPPTTPPTRRSSATTSCSGRTTCATAYKRRSSARSCTTRPATTTATARTPPRRPPATATSRRRPRRRSRARQRHRATGARVIAYSVLRRARSASSPTSPPPSTKRSPTASTSSTTRSAAPPASPAPTTWRSCSPPTPTCGSPPRTATTAPAPAPTGSPASAPWVTVGRRQHADRTFSATVALGNGAAGDRRPASRPARRHEAARRRRALGNALCRSPP